MNLTARLTAQRMMTDAGMPESSADADMLARDIIAIASEDYGDAYAVTVAARELQRRIGGLSNLAPYLGCLRANRA